ncbi:hypothetical protein GGS20DRAFT_359014 [Poronia punctata]|nr:hypothetical protein GGS20DRAFT_359014 [Poronia punctata]
MHYLLSLPAGLLMLLLPNSVAVAVAASSSSSSHRAICVRENAPLFAEAASCGNRNKLRECLLNAPSQSIALRDLETCFVEADCTIAEATVEALIIVKNCDDASGSSPELRKRGPNPVAMPEPTPQPQDNNDDKETSPATTSTPAFSTPKECSTEKLIPTTDCPLKTVEPGKVTKLPCTSTTYTSMVCAATNVCLDDGKCVYRDDHLTVSGLVATIALAAAFALALGTILTLYIREKSHLRKMRIQAESKKIREEARVVHNQEGAGDANPFAG